MLQSLFMLSRILFSYFASTGVRTCSAGSASHHLRFPDGSTGRGAQPLPLFRHQAVDLLDQQENRKCNDEEIDDSIEERAVGNDRQTGVTRFGERRSGVLERFRNRLEKSTRPSRRPMGGIRMSLTNDVTILPKAAPMMIPTAMSRTLSAHDEFLEFLDHKILLIIQSN